MTYRETLPAAALELVIGLMASYLAVVRLREGNATAAMMFFLVSVAAYYFVVFMTVESEPA